MSSVIFANAPLLAVDFWELAPFLVLVVLWGLQAINQFIVKNREAAKQQRAPRPDGNPAEADAQRDEVETFLREVVKRREVDGPARKVQPREVEVELIPPEPKETRRLVEARPTEASERTRKPLQAETLAEKRVTNPQSNVELADERMAKHMQEIFDHKVGSLRVEDVIESDAEISEMGSIREQVATSSITAAGLGAMLTDQQNLKQAIVLMEILKRPEERW